MDDFRCFHKFLLQLNFLTSEIQTLITSLFANIGIIHAFSCINICRIPRKLFEHEAAGWVFKHLSRDPANVNALKQTCLIIILAFYMIPWKLASKMPEKSLKKISRFYSPVHIRRGNFVFRSFWRHSARNVINKNQDKMLIPGLSCILVWRNVNNLRPVLRIFKWKPSSNSTWIPWFKHGFSCLKTLFRRFDREWLQTSVCLDIYARIKHQVWVCICIFLVRTKGIICEYQIYSALRKCFVLRLCHFLFQWVE